MVWDLRLHGEPGGPTTITGKARLVLATFYIVITFLSGHTWVPKISSTPMTSRYAGAPLVVSSDPGPDFPPGESPPSIAMTAVREMLVTLVDQTSSSLRQRCRVRFGRLDEKVQLGMHG